MTFTQWSRHLPFFLAYNGSISIFFWGNSSLSNLISACAWSSPNSFLIPPPKRLVCLPLYPPLQCAKSIPEVWKAATAKRAFFKGNGRKGSLEREVFLPLWEWKEGPVVNYVNFSPTQSCEGATLNAERVKGVFYSPFCRSLLLAWGNHWDRCYETKGTLKQS